MSNLASSTEYERELATLRDLHQIILLHLKVVGPTKWDELYQQFDQVGNGEVADALRDLVRLRYITIEPDTTATITTSGMEQLKGRK